MHPITTQDTQDNVRRGETASTEAVGAGFKTTSAIQAQWQTGQRHEVQAQCFEKCDEQERGAGNV